MTDVTQQHLLFVDYEMMVSSFHFVFLILLVCSNLHVESFVVDPVVMRGGDVATATTTTSAPRVTTKKTASTTVQQDPGRQMNANGPFASKEEFEKSIGSAGARSTIEESIAIFGKDVRNGLMAIAAAIVLATFVLALV